MLKKTVTYEDYNGNTVTEDLFFNINPVEMAKMNEWYPGGAIAYFENIQSSQDSMKMMEVISDIVLYAYGVKSEDGKHFNKNEQIKKEFEHSEAFIAVILDLLTSETAGVEFMTAVLPKKLVKR